ncbi:hypothetical protein NQ317_014567 [Molorchus minor]|uniref:Uncharacterized protein n=1 Tax=Molorchus minor TaxID=1323400 RepID=A0ABQ9JSN5_9CUCU|nr:hypothetical protein NQ317_014567 [Molorchus minor]
MTKVKKTPETSPKKRVLQGGVIVEDLREGQGAPAKNGRVVNALDNATKVGDTDSATGLPS